MTLLPLICLDCGKQAQLAFVLLGGLTENAHCSCGSTNIDVAQNASSASVSPEGPVVTSAMGQPANGAEKASGEAGTTPTPGLSAVMRARRQLQAATDSKLVAIASTVITDNPGLAREKALRLAEACLERYPEAPSEVAHG